jgi:hypothetical protein
MAAIFDLNGRAHIVNFWVVHLTLANVIVLVLMLLVFALAILLPFPGHQRDRSSA